MARRRRRYKPGQVPIAERKKMWYIESHKARKIEECKEEACEDEDRDCPAFEEFKEGQSEQDLAQFQRECPLLDLANALELLSTDSVAEAIEKGKARTMAPKGYVSKWIKNDLEDPLDQNFFFGDKRHAAIKAREDAKREKLGRKNYVPPIVRISEIRKMMEAAQVPELFKMAYDPVKWLARDLKPYLVDLKRSAAVKMGLAILAQLPDDEEEDDGQAGTKRGLPRGADGLPIKKAVGSCSKVTRSAARNGLGDAPQPLAVAVPAPAASQPARSITMGSFGAALARLATRNGLANAPPVMASALPAPSSMIGALPAPPPVASVVPARSANGRFVPRNNFGQGHTPPQPTATALRAPAHPSLPARSVNGRFVAVVAHLANSNGSDRAPQSTAIALHAPTAANSDAGPSAPRRSPRMN